MSSLAGIWAAVWGLLVEDGSLAIGIVAALALTWVAAVLLADAARDQVGWLLLAMLLVLVVVNLRAAGRRARGSASRSG
jgi:fucose permease